MNHALRYPSLPSTERVVVAIAYIASIFHQGFAAIQIAWAA
jgi:hypothetical protein